MLFIPVGRGFRPDWQLGTDTLATSLLLPLLDLLGWTCHLGVF
jgi:hypothetical protein